jgi:CheY-like chemotaxis protein
LYDFGSFGFLEVLFMLNIDVVSLPEVPFYEAIPSQETHRPVVLVVDDERIIADTVSFILSRAGFTVLTAYDALSALQQANVMAPELLLSDITMAPGMDGVDLAMEMVEQFPDCKIVLFSGQAGTMDLLGRARQAGHSFALLAKPMHPTALVEHVAAFLDFRGIGTRPMRLD